MQQRTWRGWSSKAMAVVTASLNRPLQTMVLTASRPMQRQQPVTSAAIMDMLPLRGIVLQAGTQLGRSPLRPAAVQRRLSWTQAGPWQQKRMAFCSLFSHPTAGRQQQAARAAVQVQHQHLQPQQILTSSRQLMPATAPAVLPSSHNQMRCRGTPLQELHWMPVHAAMQRGTRCTHGVWLGLPSWLRQTQQMLRLPPSALLMPRHLLVSTAVHMVTTANYVDSRAQAIQRRMQMCVCVCCWTNSACNCSAAGDSSARNGGATAIPAVSDRDSDTASTDLMTRMQVQSGDECGLAQPYVGSLLFSPVCGHGRPDDIDLLLTCDMRHLSWRK